MLQLYQCTWTSPTEICVMQDFAAHRRWAIRSFVLGIGSFEFRVLLYAGASRWQTGQVKLMCSSMCWMLKPPGFWNAKVSNVRFAWRFVPLSSFLVENLAVEFSSLPLCLVGGNLGIVTSCSHRQRAITSLTNILQASQCSPKIPPVFLERGLVRKLKEGETGMICSFVV